METYTKWLANQKYIAGNEEQKIFNYNEAIQLYSEAIDLNSELPQYYGQRGFARLNQLDFNLALQDARQATLLDESYIDGYLLTIKCSLAIGDVTTAAGAIITLTDHGLTAQVDLTPEQVELDKLKQLLDDYKIKFDEKDYDGCLSVMAEAIKISPGALHFQLRRAECMLLKKCVIEAMNIAQRVIELDSLSAEAHYTLGLIYFHRDMPDEAMKSLECSLQNGQEYKKANNLRVLIQQILEYKMQANNFFKVGKYEEALVVYLNILELDIKDNDEVTSKMWYNCALMNSKLRKFRAAIINCNAALQRNPKYYKAFWKRAQCHYYLQGYDNCLRDCIEAYNIEMTSEVKDLFNEAIKHSSSLINDPARDEAFKVWNELHQSELYTEAITVCSEAIKLSPMNIKFYELRIECAIKSGNYQLALKDLAALTLIDNHNESRQLIKLGCLISNGDLDEAEAFIQAIFRTDNQPINDYIILDDQLHSALEVREYFEKEKYNTCLYLLKTLCKKFNMKPLSSTYKLMKAECLYNTCDYGESMLILNEVLQSEPSNSKAHYLKGLLSFHAMKLDESIEHFTQCLEYNSEIVDVQIMLQKTKDIKAKIDLGARLFQGKYCQHADTVFNELLATLGNNDKYIRSSVLHQQAECDFACGNYDICIDNCLQILQIMESRVVQTLLDSAREKLLTTRKTIKKDPPIRENEKFKIDEGLKYLDTSNYKEACECFTEAIEVNSNNPQPYAYRAECNMHLKLYAAAISDAELSTKIDPNSSKVYFITAKCSMITGDIFRTDVILQRIQKLRIVDPVIETIMEDLQTLEAAVINATKFFNSMNYRECIEEIDTALEIAHASDHFRMIKVECLVWLGEYDDAQCILKSLTPTNEKDYIEGMISYMKNNLLNASQLLDRCIENDPGHKSAKRLLSNLKSFKTRIDRGKELMKMGKFDDALNIFTEAMVVDKKNVVVNSELHLKCAECNYRLGYLKECLNECNSALKLVPGFQEATKLRSHCKIEIDKIEKEKKVANEAATHIWIGDGFKTKADRERAIASYTKAIDLKPDQASYYAKRAECHFLFGNFESTLADARKTTELDETFISGYIWEARCSIILGETENQKKIVDKLKQIETKFTLNNDDKKKIIELKAICTFFLNATSSLEKKEYLQAIQHIDAAFLNFPKCVTMYYMIMKTECLIRLFQFNEAFRNIQQMEYTKSHHLLFLKGLWYYFSDNFKIAEEYFNYYIHHKEYQKNDEVEILMKVSVIIQDVMKPSFFSYNGNTNLLKTLNTEIAKYNHQEDIFSKEICMKLYYQRALVNEKLRKNDDAIMDCFNALCINKSYVNALKLHQNLLKSKDRYNDDISDCKTLSAIVEYADTRRDYEKQKEYATHCQVSDTASSATPTETGPMIQDDSDDKNTHRIAEQRKYTPHHISSCGGKKTYNKALIELYPEKAIAYDERLILMKFHNIKQSIFSLVLRSILEFSQ